MSFPFQIAQVCVLTSLVSKIAEIGLTGIGQRSVKVLGTVISLLSFPVLLVAAVVNHGAYLELKKIVDATRFGYLFPNTLGSRTVKVMNFLAKHTGDVTRIGMLVFSIALIAMGSHVFGGAIFAAAAYEAIDRRGYVPQKMRYYIEKILPHINTLGLFLGGNLITRVYSVVSFAKNFIPCSTNFINEKVDGFIRRTFNLGGTSLAECNLPVVERKNMNFDEINDVLDDQWELKYKINLAHCTQQIIDTSKMPQSTKYDEFMTLFNQINWEEKYALIKAKLWKVISCKMNQNDVNIRLKPCAFRYLLAFANPLKSNMTMQIFKSVVSQKVTV
ncbi:MAG: hypothetical protein H0W50_08110 [Parachlamydiaceae bacterium]|nr:hypothetical protein [Parachlamydiaceae bacterium]